MAIPVIDKNRIPAIINDLKFLHSHHIEIGVIGEQGSQLLIIASVHEFGAKIRVTAKSRAFLHSIGLHLKPTTKFIKIPERSYIRSGFDNNRDKIIAHANKLIDKVLLGEMSAQTALGRLGAYIQSIIQRQIRELQDPPLHPVTIKNKKKNSTKPLVDTGRLKASIVWEIKSN